MTGRSGRRELITLLVALVVLLVLVTLFGRRDSYTVPTPVPAPTFTPLELIPAPSLPPIADHYTPEH
jgi:hypothetical protein